MQFSCLYIFAIYCYTLRERFQYRLREMVEYTSIWLYYQGDIFMKYSV